MTNKTAISVLVERKTNRLLYILKHVFEYRMQVKFSLYTDSESFHKLDGFKLNYSKLKLPGIPQMLPSSMLFEKRMHTPNIDIVIENGLPLLLAEAKNPCGHDVFGAIFYLLSRYEEYFGYRKDNHERFTAEHSLAQRHAFLGKPLVDIYIIRLANYLNDHFKTDVFNPVRDYKQVFTLDVDQIFKYKAKGMARSFIGFIKDIFTKRSVAANRLKVILGQNEDPNEVYDNFLNQVENNKHESILFFQVGDSSRFDVNNPAHLPRVKDKINELSLRTQIGLHPSYFSSKNERIMQIEYERFNEITSTKLTKSRQHYLRFDTPKTFRQLEKIGVTDEYSMVFADQNGFRASTCFPFQFYDLEKDELTGLIMHPSIWLDITAVRKNKTLVEVFDELNAIHDEVKNVGGHFITVWHPEVLNGDDVPFGSWPIFDALVNSGE